MKLWYALLIALLAGSVTAAAPRTDTPPTSVYQLEAHLTAQDGRAIGLDVYRGQPVLVTMFYAGCQATCPLIVETLRSVERKLDTDRQTKLRVLLISIDPEHDTVDALAAAARDRRIDVSRWTLARTDAATVRRIAAVLGQQYRQLPDGQFSHSTLISVLDASGEIVAQSDRLGGADEKLVTALAHR